MVITSERLLITRTLEQSDDGDKSMIVFNSPKDVKGTSTLTFTHKIGSDDQWLFLPSIKRVKRISSNNKSGPFVGSEFAYEDLSSQEVENTDIIPKRKWKPSYSRTRSCRSKIWLHKTFGNLQ